MGSLCKGGLIYEHFVLLADEICTAQYTVFNARGVQVYPNSQEGQYVQETLVFNNNYKISINLTALQNEIFNSNYGVFTMKVHIINQDGLSKDFVFPFSRIYRQFPSNIDKCWTNVNIHFTSGSGDVATKLELAK